MPTKFVHLANKSKSSIELKTKDGSGAHVRRAALLRDLWELIETGELPHALEEFSRSHRVTAIRHLREHIAITTNYALPRTLLAMHRYRLSESWTSRINNIAPSDISFVRSLAERVEGEAGRHAAAAPESLDWVAETREEFEVLNVVLDHRAAEDMLMPVIEAYLVPGGKGKPFTETYGLCLGSHRKIRQGFKGIGQLQEHVVHVVRCVPQLRAEGAPSHVKPNDKSLDAALRVSTGLFPHLEVVGDYHSHPYCSLVELKQNDGWDYSAADETSNQAWYARLAKDNHVPVVGFVVAIARKAKAKKNPDPRAYGTNTHQVTLAGCQIVIGAHRILRNGKYSSRSVTLHSPVAPVSLY